MMSGNGDSSYHVMHGRVIVHADLDCFYCQVEHVRLGIPRSTPMAVQQWDGLIAVNYEARKFGVKRGDQTAQAKRKCPQIVFVHVETIGGRGVEGEGAQAGEDGAEPTVSGTLHDQGNSKVSLERYREASSSIMNIFQAHCRRVERASIDEAYMDFTEEAARLCNDAEEGRTESLANAPETDLQGVAGHRLDPTNAFDRALLAGARLTAAMRSAVERELGFTVSAGIASNKVLAKLASSRNKPNKQTVVSAGASSEMLDAVPVRHLRGLGGKLGESVVSWTRAETVSDLKRFTQEELMSNFGSKTGKWLWRICRGVDDEAVTPNLRPKSLSVCKSFVPVRDREGVLMWMRLLAKELADRIVVDRKTWNRRATKLTLQTISLRAANSSTQASSAGVREDTSRSASLTRSRTVDIPGGGEPPGAESLVSEAMSVFEKTENALPCSRLALTAHEFVGLVSGRRSIASFLRAPSPSTSSASPGAGRTICGPVCAQLATSDEGNEGGVTSSKAARAVKYGEESNRREANGSNGKALPREGACSSQSTSRGDVGRSRDERDVDSPSLEPGEKLCPKCGEAYASDKLPEHLDFHYAEGLQERYTREGSVAADIMAIGSDRGATKRRRVEGDRRGATRRPKAKQPGSGGSSGGAMARIDSFFKPA